MSLNDTQKAKLVRILGRNALQLQQQLDAYADDITAEMEAAVIAEMTRWDAGAGTNFTSFTSTESNEGFNLSADSAKNDIISNIETLLFFDVTAGYHGSDQIQFVRG